MITVLDSYVGTSGHVTDPEFKEITRVLDLKGIVIGEESEQGSGVKDGKAWSELVTTMYKIEEPGRTKIYTLWYQIKTPYSPKDMDCAFGFM